MTSDAKVGLLLGLVFIFLIAFLINGWPGMKSNENNNKLTISTVNSTNNLGIADNERKASRQFIQQQVRFKTPLPKIKPVVENKSALPAKPTTETLQKPDSQASIKKTVVTTVKQPDQKIQTITKPAFPKTYVVCAGDNLALIAQKFYGPHEGAKNATVMKIFKANSDVLDSPDEIYVGQKLIIPNLSAPYANYSILKPIDKKVPNAKQQSPKIYIVKDGDSLWTIAEEHLGDGSRYSDIFLMNTNILRDEDALVIGMRLKLPTQ